jgi:hypothetical protein
MAAIKISILTAAVALAAMLTSAEDGLIDSAGLASGVAANAESYLPIDIPEEYWNADRHDRHLVVHPSIIYAHDSLWGYRFWMAFTPYDAAIHENPSIVVSHDGDTWLPFVTSSGRDTLVNPIFDMNDIENSLYLSDPDIFMQGEDSLWMVFRSSYRKHRCGLWVSVTTDGAHWSEPKAILDRKKNLFSPAVLCLDDGRYGMWVVVTDPKPNRVLFYSAPRPDSGWSLVDTCRWLPSDTTLNDIWHIEILPEFQGSLAALVTENVGPGIDLKQLYLATSVDGGFSWTTRAEPLLKAGPAGAWDGRQIYRSSGILTADDSCVVLDLFYSAGGNENMYFHIGHTGVLLPPFRSPNK